MAILVVTVVAEGQGVGRRLLEVAQEWARTHGYRHTALDTCGVKERARHFSARHGYREAVLKLVKPLDPGSRG